MQKRIWTSIMLLMVLCIIGANYATAQEAKIIYDKIDRVHNTRTISTKSHLIIDKLPVVGLAISVIAPIDGRDISTYLYFRYLNDSSLQVLNEGITLIKLANGEIIELVNIASDSLDDTIDFNGTIAYTTTMMAKITPEQIKAISEKGITKIRTELQGIYQGKGYVDKEYSTPQFKTILQMQYDLIMTTIATKNGDIREGF